MVWSNKFSNFINTANDGLNRRELRSLDGFYTLSIYKVADTQNHPEHSIEIRHIKENVVLLYTWAKL